MALNGSIDQLTDDLSNLIIKQCDSILPLAHVPTYPSGMQLPIPYGNHKGTVLDMEVEEDDTWVISFPKCGTTWTQEMVWLLNNKLDYKKASDIYLSDRYKFVEFDAMFNLSPTFSEDIANLKPPRFLKTHLHKSLLPKQMWTKKPKIVYVFRNPKDAAISWYHHYRLWFNYSGPLDLFLKAFVEDKLLYTPFWDQVLEFWKLRHEPNILFITYEDMQKDLSSVVKKTADFFGVKYTADETAGLLNHLSFTNMKNNRSVNYEYLLEHLGLKKENMKFMRQGQSGVWKEVMSKDTVDMFDGWIAKNLEGSDFPLDNL